MSLGDWLSLVLHFATLSLLAVGGVKSGIPEMHRYLVTERAWLTDGQFNGSIALAQVAPGPNLMFIALLGWNVGWNGGGLLLAPLGAVAALLGIVVPSSLLTYVAARWGRANSERRAVRSFKSAMVPIVIGLLIATSWVLATGGRYAAGDAPRWLVAAAAALVLWRTRLHLMWLLCAGGLLGLAGWV